MICLGCGADDFKTLSMKTIGRTSIEKMRCNYCQRTVEYAFPVDTSNKLAGIVISGNTEINFGGDLVAGNKVVIGDDVHLVRRSWRNRR